MSSERPAGSGGAVSESEVVRIGSEPGVVVDVLALGATAQRVEVTGGDGVRRNVALGHRTDAERLASPHHLGGTVGRVASRIAAGRFELEGREVVVPVNDRGNALHGGPEGFDKRVWEVVDRGSDHVTLRLVSPDGDQGFPGEVTAEVTYRVVDGSTVRVEQRATPDAVTVVNLTNHAYFNLEGEGSGTVDDHRLASPADRYTPVDELDIPLGTVRPVDGTPLDLREPVRIGERVRSADPMLGPPQGIDANLVVPGEDLRLHATLEAPHSGLRLELWADAPCVQVYTGNKLDGLTVGTSGTTYRQGDGVALEPQAYPDAVHHPEFPPVVLRPGETYASDFEWRFSVG